MKAVIQRVTSARLFVIDAHAERLHAQIDRGLVVLVGIDAADTDADLAFIAGKLPVLRIFEDAAGKMNLSAIDTGSGILLVPNFTLAGDAHQGRRPSFDSAMRPEHAAPMFDRLADAVRVASEHKVTVITGVFRAQMRVELANDGPITILLDSRRRAE